MRDPKRIELVVRILQAVWEENPDWRLGQLVSNAACRSDARVTDPFNVEDDLMVSGLVRLAADRALRATGGEPS